MYGDNDSYAYRHRAMQVMGHMEVNHVNRKPRPQDTQANSTLTFTLNYDRR